MGTLIATYCETRKQFQQLHSKVSLGNDSLRRVLASRYRYCVGNDQFYIPLEDGFEAPKLCWVRSRELLGFDELNELIQTERFIDSPLVEGERLLQGYDVRIGGGYCKRRIETDTGFHPVNLFIADTIFDGIAKNPDALDDVSKSDFEALCAEIFVRRGFEVDLYRSTKDGGIDFISVNSEEDTPSIFAVQCKQPDIRLGKPRRSLGRPVVQQIYGAAKAWDLDGAVAISGAKYSKEAKSFQSLKPEEMKVYDKIDLLSWIEKYRWNEDE